MRVSNERFSMWVMLTTFSVIALVILSVNAQSPPSNDMFGDAVVINGSDGRSIGHNYGATLEPNEPASCTECKTVWYRWTAPANLSMTFSVNAPRVWIEPPPPPQYEYLNDSVLGVYMGNDVGSLTMLTWNDDIWAGDRSSRVTFAARSGQVYSIRIYGGNGMEGLVSLAWEINGGESWKQFNFDGCSPLVSRKSDFGVFRPSDGFWWLNAIFAPYRTVQWGVSDDVPVAGDYFGDGCSDVAIFRPGDGNWWILDQPTGNTTVVKWGMPGDIPVRGDFDGDDKADLAIWRPSTEQFWILNSIDGSVRVDSIPWEACYPNECWSSPITADYDGDGKTDLGLNISTVWGGYFSSLLIRRSSDGDFQGYDWYGGDVVKGDFDGDGKGDMGIYANNTFNYRRSSDGSTVEFRWGLPGDIPVFGDYGGSPGSDLCIWRPSDGNLYCYDPIEHRNWQYRWGIDGDKPIAAPAF